MRYALPFGVNDVVYGFVRDLFARFHAGSYLDLGLTRTVEGCVSGTISDSEVVMNVDSQRFGMGSEGLTPVLA